jgi:hypothetical protein
MTVFIRSENTVLTDDFVADWPHSSFHRYEKLGIYPLDWGGGNEFNFDAGE